MEKIINLVVLLFMITSVNCQNNEKPNFETSFNAQEHRNMNYNKLSKEEESVILHKGTERPFTGKYNDFFKEGTFNCKQCGNELYKSDTKFDGHCGWPSFDEEIIGAVKRIPDADGRRTEIVCANCGAHLGHVFSGEGFTDKNTRHCVNSISLSFSPVVISDRFLKPVKSDREIAVFASGCFWGTEHWMKRQKGVISTDVGYIGGYIDNPTYEQVCSHKTGHAEAVRVIFNPSEVNYEILVKLFFETHDPTQVNKQGPDIGDQYRSEIFYFNDSQKQIAEKLIIKLKNKGVKVVTILTEASKFWPAEDYHQNYYENKGSKPYCHFYIKRF